MKENLTTLFSKGWQIMIRTIIASMLVIGLTTSAFAFDATLVWDPSPSPDATSYNLYMSLDPAVAQPINVYPTTNLTYTLTGLDNAEVYYFAVTALDASGNESVYSNIVTSGDKQPPLPPGILTIQTTSN
jgi:fibronectin type 3 domain-containing protein